jgi:4-amino-4-deoxy-L-arabinose transferase-like glycosyltransferase
LALGALAVACSVALLFNLGEAPVQLWDEARVAINALEMLTARNPLIVTYHGEPDLWNPKPPLATLLAALSMQVGGINEFALRTPSAAAAAATVFAVYFFTKWASGSRLTGLVAGMVLLGTGGYVEAHVARTAEPDSLMVLFLTLMAFGLVRFIEETPAGRHRERWLYAAAAALAGAMLTKGVAAFLMLPGSVLGLLVLGKLKLFRTRATYLAGAALVAVALLYWGGRELAQAGYLTAVWNSELGRYNTALRGAAAPWHYYVSRLVWPWQATPFFGYRAFTPTSSAFPWSLLLLVCAPLAIAAQNPRIRTAALFLLCCLITFIAAISAAATKLPWYGAPAYPLIAVLSALGLGEIAKRLANSPQRLAQAVSRCVLPIALAAAVVSTAFVVWKNEQVARIEAQLPEHRLGYFLRHVTPELPTGRPIRVVSDAQVQLPGIRRGRIHGHEPYDGPAEFYIAALSKGARNVRLVSRTYAPSAGDLIVACGSLPPQFRGLAVRLSRADCRVLSTARAATALQPCTRPIAAAA